MSPDNPSQHYFVDEAGDLSFFDRKGWIVVGKPGVSRYFMVGVARIADPAPVAQVLNQFRVTLLDNPRYQNIPSLQPAAKKTAIAFHAKDDYGEIREQVFERIQSFDLQVFVAIRSKLALAQAARIQFQQSGKKLYQNVIYDDLIERLFKAALSEADRIQIAIARRGKAAREAALEGAIARSQQALAPHWSINPNRSIQIEAVYPSQAPGLQVIDYCLWALQRLYEREEDRYFQLLAPKYRLMMDLDDCRHHPNGERYCEDNPLTLQKLREARSSQFPT